MDLEIQGNILMFLFRNEHITNQEVIQSTTEISKQFSVVWTEKKKKKENTNKKEENQIQKTK